MASASETSGTWNSPVKFPMADISSLSTEKIDRRSRDRTDEDETIVTEDSPVISRVRSLSRAALGKQYFQKRYCLWVLAALSPFIVLRLMILYAPLQSRSSSPSTWRLGNQDIAQEAKCAEARECNLLDGNWVDDPDWESPLYTNATCSYIQDERDCLGNGRADTDFLRLKWKPRECDLPRFDAKSFLDSFRGKSIAFVGDSLARNQKESLVCMLEQVEVPKIFYTHSDYQSLPTARWLFEQHQVTLAILWSPFLVKENHKGIMGFEEGQSVLFLDVLDDTWTSVMSDFDILVISTGPWYLREAMYAKQDELFGCAFCPKLNLTELGFYYAYRHGLRLALEKVATEFKGVVVMNTFSVSHFEKGTWVAGGQCRREKPLEPEEGAFFPGPHNDMHDIAMSEFDNIANDKSRLREDVHFEFLDMTRLTLLRADGHPGPYRHANPYQGRNPGEWVVNDCVHWCQPGPIDTWNQLLVKLLQKYIS